MSSTYRELECGVRPGMRVVKDPWSAGEGLFTLFLFVQLPILLLLQLTILLVQVLVPLAELLIFLRIQLLILHFIHL